jgi:6-phosphogluconolactonase
MKRIAFYFVLLAWGQFMTESLQASQLLYLASTDAKTVAAHAIDPQTGKLSLKFTVDLPGNAGPMAFSPDRSFIYVGVTGLEGGKAGVATLRRATDGSLILAGTATITSRAPYIGTDKSGRYLLAAHYGEGDVTVYRIVDGVCTSELLDHHVTERTAHCIELDPSGQFAFVPHTSPNKVYQFRLDASTGKLIPNSPPFVEGPDTEHKYHEPRHYRHHPSLPMGYTSNENGGGISAWAFNPETGTLALKQTLSSLPPGFEGRSAGADIQITPDGRFAYVSNRDLTDRGGAPMQDTLAGFALDPQTGAMQLIGHFPTAWFPRSICIDLDGKFVYAAGQRSSTLFAYSIDPQTGRLEHIETYETGKTPIWVMCGRVAPSDE